MKTPNLRDTLLILVLTGGWCAIFVLHLDSAAAGQLAWLPVGVDGATGPADFPEIRSLWREDALTDGLAIGDEVLAVADTSLEGSGRLGFVTSVFAASSDGGVSLRTRRGGVISERQIELPEIVAPFRKGFIAASFALLAALALWRTRGSREGRIYFLTMTAYAYHWTDFWGGSALRTSAAIACFGIATAMTAPLALRAAMQFPAEVARNDPFSRTWPWLFLAAGPLMTMWGFGLPMPWAHADLAGLAFNAVFILFVLGLVTQNYRASGGAGRRQLRWVLLGLWVGLVPAFLASNVALIVPELWWLYEFCLVLAVLIPVSILIALLRSQLFDVDRLITATATYTTVGIAALAGIFFVAPRASAATANWIDPDVGQSAFSLVFGAIVFLGLRRADQALQHRLYPERRALLEDSQLLRRDIAECEKPIDILVVLGRRLRSLLRLETVAVYAKAQDSFAPVFSRGPGVCPAFDADGSLVEHLDFAKGAVETSDLSGLAFVGPDIAALESMGVELVLPVRAGDAISAFVCLGEKRSGDVFTGPDRALLQGLADKAGDELERFDRATVERETRERAERMRTFVPGAVARELEEGNTLKAGEQEITVLFADIRGYTPFSEGQTPAAIFEAISRYTALVSEIVEAHGGAVVEFHGDGLMAVFGAPKPLEQKESRAIETALQVALEVPKLDIRGSDGEPRPLEVGVGVATGPGYVGPLRTVDRSIWTALGNTTNLAARLEQATRALDVSVVVDSQTRAAAEHGCQEFALVPAFRVKGRRQPLDVHTWSPPQGDAPGGSKERPVGGRT